MNRNIIGSLWDRSNRNGMNSNFEYLFEGSKRVTELNNRAEGILIQSQQVINQNKDVQRQLNDIILGNGTSEAEVVQARGGYSVLNERLNETDAQMVQQINLSKNQVSILDYEDIVFDNDWSTAFKAAHDDLPDTGGVINVPTTCTIKKPVVFTKRIYLKGIDFTHTLNFLNSSRIIKDGNFDGITIEGYSSFIENLSVDGATGNGGDGIVIASSRVGMRNVTSMRHGNDGFRLGKNVDDNLNGWNFTNLFALGNVRDGIHFHHEGDYPIPNLTAGMLNGIDARGNGRDGVHVGRTLSNSFYGVMSQHNGRNAVRVTKDARGNHFYNPYTESSGAGPNEEFYLEDGSLANYVFGQRAGLAYNSITNLSNTNKIVTNNPQLVGAGFYDQTGTFTDRVVVGNRDLSGFWEMYNGSLRNLHIELNGTSVIGRLILWHQTKRQIVEVGEIQFKDSPKIMQGFDAFNATIPIPIIPAGSSIDVTRDFVGVDQYTMITAHPIGTLQDGLIWSIYPTDGKVTLRIANVKDTASTSQSIPFRFTAIKSSP